MCTKGGSGNTATTDAIIHALNTGERPLPADETLPGAGKLSVSDGRKDCEAVAAIQLLLMEGRGAAALAKAVSFQLWPLALIIGKSLGPTEWQQTVQAFAAQNFGAASPLSTFCNVVAGGNCSPFPDAATQSAVATTFAGAWRQHATIVMGQHGMGCAKALEELGQLLVASNKIAAAHVCFALAGVPLQYSDAAPHRFALLGTRRDINPRTYASIHAIMRMEMYTWARTIGEAAVRLPSNIPLSKVHQAVTVHPGPCLQIIRSLSLITWLCYLTS